MNFHYLSSCFPPSNGIRSENHFIHYNPKLYGTTEKSNGRTRVARRFGDVKVEEIKQLIETLPIKLVEADKTLTREAARIKATKPMAYADCFAVALARLRKAELYTGDPEFKVVEKEVRVVWL